MLHGWTLPESGRGHCGDWSQVSRMFPGFRELQARAVGLVGSDQKEEMSALEGQVARLGQRVGRGQ